MELRQLRHFLALAELGSFTAAAAREHIVQSGLSSSVQQRLVRFADYVAEFAAAHPAVDVHLLQAPALAMLRMVAAGELDCGIVTAG